MSKKHVILEFVIRYQNLFSNLCIGALAFKLINSPTLFPSKVLECIVKWTKVDDKLYWLIKDQQKKIGKQVPFQFCSYQIFLIPNNWDSSKVSQIKVADIKKQSTVMFSVTKCVNIIISDFIHKLCCALSQVVIILKCLIVVFMKVAIVSSFQNWISPLSTQRIRHTKLFQLFRKNISMLTPCQFTGTDLVNVTLFFICRSAQLSYSNGQSWKNLWQ